LTKKQVKSSEFMSRWKVHSALDLPQLQSTTLSGFSMTYRTESAALTVSAMRFFDLCRHGLEHSSRNLAVSEAIHQIEIPRS
jgi:hypothetical protein